MATQESPDKTATLKSLRTGEKLYRLGEGARHEALAHYRSVYPYNQTLAGLNYKIGVCYLQSTRPDMALEYFEKCQPNVT